VDRVACADIPALPLQILLQQHPEWADGPVAVVDSEKSVGTIQWVNKHARVLRITPGMRYTTALSLSRNLQGSAVAESDIQKSAAVVLSRLWNFSPIVEPSSREPGVFWIDPGGLERLYASHATWAAAIHDDLKQAGFHSVMAVGFTRFGSYATTKATHRNIVFAGIAQERAYVRRVPIAHLRFEPRVRDTLLKLGIDTLGEFIELPANSLRRRFNDDTCELHQLATKQGWESLDPKPILEPIKRTAELEYPESDLERLLLIIAPLLQSMLQELATRRQVMMLLRFRLGLDNKASCRERLSPATPTLDIDQLIPLLRLRIESLPLQSGITELTLQCMGIRATRRQLELFRQTQERDLAAIHRAFAEIRANMGHDAVVYAQLHERHLPEARFSWEPVKRLDTPHPIPAPSRPLVRRIYSRPIELRSRLRHEPDGWIVGRMQDGPVEEVVGPQIIAGGWWSKEVSRAYYYVRTRTGRWFWIYNDQVERRWFLQGEVE